MSRARDHVASPPAKSPATPLPKVTAPMPIIGSGSQGLSASTRGGKVSITPSKPLAKKGPTSTSPKTREVASVVFDASGVDQGTFSSTDASGVEEKTKLATIPTSEPELEQEAGSEVRSEGRPEIEVPDKEKLRDESPPTSAPSQTWLEIQTEPKQAKEEATVNGNGLAVNSHDVQEVEEPTPDQIADKLTVLASKHDANDAGTDIEQIVNLLEVVPQSVTRDPSDTVNTATPSELQEIPDEEH